MNENLNWLRMDIELELNQLESYLSELTDAIKNSAKQFAESVEARAAKLPEEQRDQYYEWHLDTYWEFTDVFPNMLNNSLFVTMYSFFEVTFRNIAKDIEKKSPNGIKIKDLRGDGIEQSQTYLKKVHSIKIPDESEEWENITIYRKIRNIIIHNDRKIRTTDETVVKPYIEKNPTHFKLDQFNIHHRKSTDVSPWMK